MFDMDMIRRVSRGPKFVDRHNKRAEELGLTASLTNYEWEKTLEYFGGRCALNPKSKDVQMAHFIPLEWDIGGTFMGNLIPLDRRLNEWWSRNNPMYLLSHGGVLRDRSITLERRDRLFEFILSYRFPGQEKPFESIHELFDFTFPHYKERRMGLVNSYYEEHSKKFDLEQQDFHRWCAKDWKKHWYYTGK